MRKAKGKRKQKEVPSRLAVVNASKQRGVVSRDDGGFQDRTVTHQLFWTMPHVGLPRDVASAPCVRSIKHRTPQSSFTLVTSAITSPGSQGCLQLIRYGPAPKGYAPQRVGQQPAFQAVCKSSKVVPHWLDTQPLTTSNTKTTSRQQEPTNKNQRQEKLTSWRSREGGEGASSLGKRWCHRRCRHRCRCR